MTKSVSSMAAILALLLVGSLMIAAETTPVNQVVFTNGTVYDGKVPTAYDPVVKAVRGEYPNATFTVSDGVLKIGLGLKDEAKGEVFSIKWQSDCPVNSQYNYNNPAPIIAKVMRPVLIAWTQVRHPALEGSVVERYQQGDNNAEVVLASTKK